MKLTAHVGIDCTSGGEVEGDTLEDCVDKAWEDFGSPFVCHHCSRGMDVGDATSLLLTNEEGDEVYEDSMQADEAKRVKGMVEYIEDLKAENEALKAKQYVLMLFASAALDDMKYLLKNQKLDGDGSAVIDGEAATELNELISLQPTQCLAQIKHDAIIETVSSLQYENGSGAFILLSHEAEEHAANLLTQAQESE